jgi:hypothetical protein
VGARVEPWLFPIVHGNFGIEMSLELATSWLIHSGGWNWERGIARCHNGMSELIVNDHAKLGIETWEGQSHP